MGICTPVAPPKVLDATPDVSAVVEVGELLEELRRELGAADAGTQPPMISL
jgi:hypothetical protein